MLIRLGLPIPGGSLLRAAKEIGAPLLISATAFMRKWPRAERWNTPFPGFTRPSGALAGCDVALDSAGFVAMTLTNGYEWTVEQYVDLAASFPWTWWSQMDLCCEPEIAGDRDRVRERQAETRRLYAACAREAVHRGIKRPMPILQGWTPDDYARAVECSPDGAELLGVGSVCRRRLGGPDGLAAVVERIDRELAAHKSPARLHLFGVKSEGIEALAQHPRIASVDSMAWDYQSRRKNAGSNTMSKRTVEMHGWYRKQIACSSAAGALQSAFGFASPDPVDPLAIPEDLLELIADGEIELRSVSHHFIELWIADSA